MPVLKNPHQLKAAGRGPRESGGGGSPSGTLILAGESPGTNPFEEDLEESEKDSFLGGISPRRERSLPRDRADFERGLFSGSPEDHFRRRATLEKLVGLSPFRLGKGRKGGEKRSPGGEQASDRRSFLERIMLPLMEGGLGQRVPEKKKPRRCSEDFSLLQRFNGRRKEGLYSSDCGLAEENGGGEAAKRGSFLKIGLGGKVRRASLVEKLNQTEGSEAAPAAEKSDPKPKEPLSVLEIFHLIHQRDLGLADRHIVELEAECAQGGGGKDGSRKAKDVALLYQALQKELWAVLAEALAAKSAYPPLEQLVQVIEQEEEADRRWRQVQADAVGAPGARPRKMRQQWAEAVDRLVGQKLCQCIEGRVGTLATQMDRLAKCTVEDLSSVRGHLLQAYPKEYQAFGVYLGSYHRGLARCLAEGVRKQLSLSELYFVLDWNSNIYQREVLRRLEISPLVKPQELGPLLSPETQRSLEEQCMAGVKVTIIREMSRELQEEEARWAQEDKESSFQFGLSSKVILVLKGHVDKALQITEDFGRRVAHCCLASLAEFLQSFQKKVEKFHEGQAVSSLSPESYMGRTIMLVNCCPPFRDYLESLASFGHPDSETAKQLAVLSLDRVTRLGNRVLADQLFQSLKPLFYKLMKRKWLSNHEAFSTIMALLAEHAQKLSRMKLGPYQVRAGDPHRRVLIEYVRPLMRVRIICTSAKMRAKVASRLRGEARQLQEFFVQLESSSSWLDSVVPHLAGILELEDTPAIQMEVAFLARAFPDVQKKHLAALLDVRGLQSQAQRQLILAALDSLEPAGAEVGVCQDRAFFSEIATREVFCVRVQLHRLSHLGLACISRMRRRPPRLQRPRGRGLREKGAGAEL
ncbi:exocyst complex component 3-like [Notechis scutatus]|uniref:Exocyst complex component 3-like n=1 Tax=Notechis scutatus TaxID=8663 RepID=A0A6J1VTD3_9SAUR|nr:exocyst complex component 3-like [Notechis scutatus]XP_026546359.1 exocyst complex component 3-like [Notechis scutatus]